MTTIEITSRPATEIDTDLLVAYLPEKDGSLSIDSEEATAAAHAVQACAKAGERTIIPGSGTGARRIAVIGAEVPERLRRRQVSLDDALEMCGTGAHRHYSAIAVRGTKAADVTLAGTYRSEDDVIQAALGAVLGARERLNYRKCEESSPELKKITVACSAECDGARVERVVNAYTEAMGFAMDVVNRAPNDLYPQSFAEAIEQACQGDGLSVEVWDEERLAAEGCGGILGVGRGSHRPPRLVIVRYQPAEDGGRPLALVGKGITFDSGGISIKPSANMGDMKSDMAGAATACAAVIAAARCHAPNPVTAYLALAENMPGGRAQRPSDVVVMRDGTAVEVTNTDAEGRLVMADALALAAESDATAIVDIATLTGAQVVALGERVAGVMGSPAVRDALAEAGRACGEPLWPMPLPSYLMEGFDSPVADFTNSGPRPGGMLSAGLFLEHFAGDKPWAHVDIAGPSYNASSQWGASNKGGTAMGTLTLARWLGAN